MVNRESSRNSSSQTWGGEAGCGGCLNWPKTPVREARYLEVSLMLSAFPGGICQIPKLASEERQCKERKGQSSIFCTSVVLRQLKLKLEWILREKANWQPRSSIRNPKGPHTAEAGGTRGGANSCPKCNRTWTAHSLPGLRWSITSRSAYQRRCWVVLRERSSFSVSTVWHNTQRSTRDDKAFLRNWTGRETRNSGFTDVMSLELSERDINICINKQSVQEETMPQRTGIYKQ